MCVGVTPGARLPVLASLNEVVSFSGLPIGINDMRVTFAASKRPLLQASIAILDTYYTGLHSDVLTPW